MDNKTKAITGLGVMASSLLMPQVAHAQQRPNIIFIYTDDMGYNDLGCYGSKVNDTPNIDRMADEGMRFTDFYASSPVSSPSRAGLMTGRYQTRQGINYVFQPYSLTGLSSDEVTIPEVLRPCGYSTVMYGKWHLGSHYEFRPKRQGFDEYFGSLYSIDNGPFVYVDGDAPDNKLAVKDSTTYVYTTKACHYIEEHKNKGPFFMYLAYNMPHVPLYATEKFLGKSRNGLYGDVIMELDWGVGEILKTVKEAGIDENTIICFASDNGPWLHEGPYGGNADPLYSGKSTTWDGGLRVPMIVRWPGHIKPKQVESSVACMMDWFVTFAKMVGGTIPEDRFIDGYDIMPVLLGTGQRANQDFAYISSHVLKDSDVSAYRSGDWKIKLPEPFEQGNYWYPDEPAHDTLLFNLREDIGEHINVKDEHPEIVKMLCDKIDSLRNTEGFFSEPLLQFDPWTGGVTTDQRRENILKAAKAGIKPKSKNGEYMLENYRLQDKLNKAGANTY